MPTTSRLTAHIYAMQYTRCSHSGCLPTLRTAIQYCKIRLVHPYSKNTHYDFSNPVRLPRENWFDSTVSERTSSTNHTHTHTLWTRMNCQSGKPRRGDGGRKQAVLNRIIQRESGTSAYITVHSRYVSSSCNVAYELVISIRTNTMRQ